MNSSKKLDITVLGTGSCTPPAGGETASFCINDRLLVDTGWCAAQHMRRFGLDPLQVEAVLLTHCHHDHYMGLVSILFSQGLAASRDALPRDDTADDQPQDDSDAVAGGGLQLYGPQGHVQRVLDDAFRFLQVDEYPHLSFPVRIHGLSGGDEFETCGLLVRSMEAKHNIAALHFRIENQEGAAVTISGDTAYNPQLIEFARDSDLLIHEASIGAGSTQDNEDAAHSGATDAATIARHANVDRLAVVHVNTDDGAEIVTCARKTFPHTFVPNEGAAIEL